MHLSIEDVAQFFRAHRALMLFVNQRLGVTGAKLDTPEEYASLPPEQRSDVHQALLDHMDLIDAFVAENPARLDADDLEIVRSWKHLVTGTFYAFRLLRDHMIFLSTTEPVVAYGVLALFTPFEDLLGPELPQLIDTTLLPFKGRIVYDGLIASRNVSFGGGVKKRLNEEYKEAKERFGVVTSLPMPEAPPSPPVTRPTPKGRAKGAGAAKKGPSADAARLARDRIVALTDAFCAERLDDEYRDACRNMAGALSRKRPSPLTRGKPESWASGIVRAVGYVNFLGDPSQPHHMKMTDIDAGFGVSEATGSAKATEIRRLLDIDRFDPAWTLPSMMIKNPMAWMVQVNGLVADARRLPREIQEEAFRKGLIPFVPDGSDED